MGRKSAESLVDTAFRNNRLLDTTSEEADRNLQLYLASLYAHSTDIRPDDTPLPSDVDRRKAGRIATKAAIEELQKFFPGKTITPSNYDTYVGRLTGDVQ